MTADDYIDSVLEMMPRATPRRAQIAMELRAHIAERVADGHALDEVLRQLGDPERLADSYLSAVTLMGASFGLRAVAKLVDAVLAVAIVGPIAWLLSRGVSADAVFVTVVIATAFCGAALCWLYSVMTEFAYGQTLGKRLCGIHTVRESGRRIGLGQAIVRQLPMLLQFYYIDVLFALFTDKGQRAFEMLSKTRVVLATDQHG